ncbi:PadR family transcriptional regulator [Leptolyngbya cf. ectocarpi LEGE 11479]|uniref:PadR family transcriptional regulator n=1 Tax=Leptolyngbya cf. ectocarpi LEGE 11479 TaxID=1828722 RepID=A0A928ZZU1_LEPEC|nr:PadR family transcriptional regulator [Leptolyngbya ectocarpi]MBE9070467.1 PadR family transcriptional regulator [Leptolyngbya cf. ectocarpi LEGE 11479]
MALAHTILALLAQRPDSGYDISKRFDEGLSCYWKATQQQVYRELSKMEAQGWVDFEKVPQEGKPDKKIYSITEPGWVELTRWYAEPTERTQIREDLLVKVMIGYKMPRELLLKELHHRQTLHQAQLEEYRTMEEMCLAEADPSVELQFKYLTLKRGIAYETSWLQWCADVLTFLEQHSEPGNTVPAAKP